MAKATGGSKKRAAKTTASAVAAAPPKRRLTFFRPRRLMLAAGVGLTALLLPLAVRQLPSIHERSEYRITAAQISLTASPRWVPPDLATEVFSTGGFSDRESLQDDSLAERIAAAFHTHPWVERVVSVKKSFPARVHVDVIYREPVAMVRGIDGHYPVDRHGVLLPARDFSDADVARYPVIERVASVPVGHLGEPWGDPVVHGAAELAAELCRAGSDGQSWWKSLDLAAILVPRRVVLEGQQEDLEFGLRTAGGSEILWGHSPGTKFPHELTPTQKLQRLADYRHDYGGFDDQHGPYQIDIRPWQGIGRTTLARETDGGRRQ
jgi:hypothetical protein